MSQGNNNISKVNQFIDDIDKITISTQEQSTRMEEMQKTLQSINSKLDDIEMSIRYLEEDL